LSLIEAPLWNRNLEVPGGVVTPG